MATRTRTRFQTGNSGEAVLANDRWMSEVTYYSTCVDEAMQRNQTFRVDHVSLRGAGISHRYLRPSGYWLDLHNWMPQYFRDPRFVQHLTVPGEPSLAASAVKVAYATNPSKPYMDLPVSFIELRELPDLVRSFGRGMLKRVADGNLRYEFGVKPMISDFIKLLDFKKAMDHQVKLINKLQKGGITRTAQIWSGSTESGAGPNEVMHSNPNYLLCYYRREKTITSSRYWGYMTWTPDPVKLDTFQAWDEHRVRLAARQIVFGATIDASVAWELLPWSWLADWFSNVGEWLSANRSLIPVRGNVPSICIERRTQALYVSTGNVYGLQDGAHSVTAERISKHRLRQSATLPSATYPNLLTGRQSAILGSLATLRVRGRL